MNFVVLFPEAPADVDITIKEKPITINHMYGQKGHRRFLSAAGRKFKIKLAELANLQERLGAGDIFMSIDYYFPDRRRRDVTNYDKPILDALSSITYDDDKQVSEIILRKHIDKENPRTEIKLWRK